MTVLEDVAALVKQVSPHGICDDCIAKELSLTVRQHANHKTRELASSSGPGFSGFRREKDLCNTCKNVKLVISHT
ncbi:MAG: hypothetical protein E5Y89_19865 [Mesorhizobium sp.]|nr:MAG: hypothetical protein E5Y89_19865 [Mesorhizobium sp.]